MARTVRVLAAFDSFKDCLDATSVGKAVVKGCERTLTGTSTGVESKVLSLSDGGEGFVESLRAPMSLQLVQEEVTGPLGEPLMATWGVCNRGPSGKKTAVIEMAAASGLEHVPVEKRNPLFTTTRGTGQLIRSAVSVGCEHILLGVGGSATNDGGLGALAELGLVVEIEGETGVGSVYGKHLSKLKSLAWENGSREAGCVLPANVNITIACDVNNPFTGPNGATAIYGPQKGAKAGSDIARELEEGMCRLAGLYKDLSGVDISTKPGAGAAGGIAGGFCAILGADLKRGVEIMADAVGLRERISNSDIVFTGEGSFDSQSGMGKVVSLVQDIGRACGVPVVVICGRKSVDAELVFDTSSEFGKEASMNNTSSCLEEIIGVKAPVLRRLVNLDQEHAKL